MPKVYTRKPGSVIEIGHYGPASNDQGVEVPEAVARELGRSADLRVVRDEVAPPPVEPLRKRIARHSEGAPSAEEKPCPTTT